MMFSFLWLASIFTVIQGQTKEELSQYLAENKCQSLGVSAPMVALQNENNMRCAKVAPEKVSTDAYYDDKKLMVNTTTIYTAFQGQLTYHDNTPKYCFDNNNNLKSFNFHFDSNTLDTSIRTELTPCRAGGFHTNGKVLCQPPECSKYQKVPTDTDYFQDELYVTYNMKDLARSKTKTNVIVTHFTSPKDPRQIYNITSNQTSTLSTADFYALCAKKGPCYGGKFLNSNDIFYSYAGFPQLLMKIEDSRTFIAMRHDPRPFCLIEKQRPRPCMFKADVDHEVCESPAGTHSWSILWKSPLPYKKEWLPLHWYIRWSHKYDCIIKVVDTESKETLINYEGPCGRTHDMSTGNYPYPSVGIFSKGMEVPVKMRFKDIKFDQTGPTSSGMIPSG